MHAPSNRNPIGELSVAEHNTNTKEAVLRFWFGELDEAGECHPDVKKRWFTKDAAFDQEIRDKFGSLYALLAATGTVRPPWVEGPEGLLSAIIVLDQFSRNMFRDSPAMYAADGTALSLTYELIALGYDRKLSVPYRTFSYMPLMHSERLADQERCIELFQALGEELDGDQRKAIEANTHYAVLHRDIVARFGRFPHRNAILGRPSTEDEQEFLKQPNSGF